MGAEQIKAILHLRIEQADERFLRILHAMTEAYANEHLDDSDITDEMIMAIPPSPDWKRLTKEEMLDELQEAMKQVDRGEYTTLEDLEKEMEQW
jgi:hypothetical protein